MFLHSNLKLILPAYFFPSCGPGTVSIAGIFAGSGPASATSNTVYAHSHRCIHLNNVPSYELQVDLEGIHLYPANVWLAAQ